MIPVKNKTWNVCCFLSFQKHIFRWEIRKTSHKASFSNKKYPRWIYTINIIVIITKICLFLFLLSVSTFVDFGSLPSGRQKSPLAEKGLISSRISSWFLSTVYRTDLTKPGRRRWLCASGKLLASKLLPLSIPNLRCRLVLLRGTHLPTFGGATFKVKVMRVMLLKIDFCQKISKFFK